jgi:hypothetical protein
VGAAERADEVRGQDELPELFGHGVEVGEIDRLQRARGARVVDQDVKAPEPLDRLADHALGVARLRDVAGCGDHLEAGAGQARDLLGRPVVLGQVVHGHRRAVLRKNLHRRKADARRAAGDEDGFSGEVGADHGPLPSAVIPAEASGEPGSIPPRV